MSKSKTEIKREEILTRIKRLQTGERIRNKRVTTFHSAYVTRILPGRTANEIHLTKVRAASRYNKLPKEVKEVMQQNGFDPLTSKHYAIDIF